ncbi:MAG: DUF4363 family protein [Candidatus Howiella sp.]
MKRLILTAAIFLILILLCTAGLYTVSSFTEEMDGLLERAILLAEAGRFEAAAELAQAAEDRWVEIEPKISFFVNHDVVSAVGESVAGLPPLAKEETASDFLSLCRTAKISLVHLADSQRVSLYNIF